MSRGGHSSLFQVLQPGIVTLIFSAIFEMLHGNFTSHGRVQGCGACDEGLLCPDQRHPPMCLSKLFNVDQNCVCSIFNFITHWSWKLFDSWRILREDESNFRKFIQFSFSFD